MVLPNRVNAACMCLQLCFIMNTILQGSDNDHVADTVRAENNGSNTNAM